MGILFKHLSLLAASFGLAATPLLAQADSEEGDPLPDFDAMTTQEAFATYSRESGRWSREPCTFGVPLLAVMQAGEPDNEAVTYISLFAAALCADKEDRYDDGAALVRQINALDPDEPEVGLSLYFARRTEDAGWILELLSGLEGEKLGSLNPETFWSSVRTVRKGGLGDEFDALALRWFEDSKIGFIDGDLYGGLARSALASAAREDRTDIAPQLLGYVSSPGTFVDLLTLRKYEPIWPQIEERAGPNLALVGEEDVETTRRRMANAPSDRDRFSAAAYALHFNGDFEAAIELAQSWREREERGLELEEGDGWALNIQAYAYDSLGQPELADAVFEELAAVDPEENGWVVSFVINRASRLVGHGRWEEGLEAARYARSVPGSTYAEMIVARDHSCALSRLGREEEALAELDFMRENSEASAGLLATALLCNGLRDEAAQVMLAALRDPTQREGAITGLLPASADLFYTQTILPSPRELMADYPELAAEFSLHARELPEAFEPRASQRRVQLDLPAWN